MADMLTIDPFFALTGQVASTREKMSDSVFENYKLQVAQTNDINNRAMQVALHNASDLSAIKQSVSNGVLQNMLAAQRTESLVAAANAGVARAVIEQGELTRRLVTDLNTQNLNTALINTNTALTGMNGLYGGLGLAYGGAVSAVQSANQVNALNSVGSAVSGQRLVNTGDMATTSQTSTPTSIR